MNSLSHIIHTISYMALPLLFAMVLHEYAHGWMAEKCGDSTAKNEGRLTINPLAHIDPFGTVILPLICLVLPGSFLLGWAKPVPYDPRFLKSPKKGAGQIAIAGPISTSIGRKGGLLIAGVLFFVSSVGAGFPEFFWSIFGAGAVALWLILAFWIGLFVLLAHVALNRLGARRAALLLPFLWTGLEYFRSELYYLRFSWLSVGFAFADLPGVPGRYSPVDLVAEDSRFFGPVASCLETAEQQPRGGQGNECGFHPSVCSQA